MLALLNKNFIYTSKTRYYSDVLPMIKMLHSILNFHAHPAVYETMTSRDDAKLNLPHSAAAWRLIGDHFGISSLSPSQHGHPSGTNIVYLERYRSTTPGLAASQLLFAVCVCASVCASVFERQMFDYHILLKCIRKKICGYVRNGFRSNLK